MCACVWAVRLSDGVELFGLLKDAFLAFLAVTDFLFESQCWMWGKYPHIVLFDACMELPCNFVTEEQLTASRPELEVDSDLVMILLKLSLVSPIYFGGIRVQFMLGAGDTVGNSPAWMSPSNRISERFRKTPRGALQDAGRDIVKGGNGALLVERLAARGDEIGDVDSMGLVALKSLCTGCAASSLG